MSLEVKLLLETDKNRHFKTVRAVRADIPQLAIHSFIPVNRSDLRYALTHIKTGRALSSFPLTMDEITELIRELRKCNIEWDKISNADNTSIERFFVEKISQRVEEICLSQDQSSW